MQKNILKISVITGLALGLAACGSTKNPNGNYRINSKQLSVVQADVDQKILESSERINRRLALLNESQQAARAGQGTQATHKVPMTMNIKEISNKDVELMIAEGRSTNNPSKRFDMTLEKGVMPDVNYDGWNKFYEKPVQNHNQAIKTTEIVSKPTTANLKPIDLSQMRAKQQVQIIKSLDRNVALNGEYELTKLLRTLADGAGYQFVLNGKDVDHKLTISPFNGSIKDALITVGNQIGNKALINVNTKSRVIALEYK